MHLYFIITLIVLGVAALIGAIVAFFAFRKAPNGFEDEKGFHPDREHKR